MSDDEELQSANSRGNGMAFNLKIGGEDVKAVLRRIDIMVLALIAMAGLCAWSLFSAEWAAKQSALDVWVIVNLEGVMAQHGVPVPPCLRMNGLGQIPDRKECK